MRNSEKRKAYPSGFDVAAKDPPSSPLPPSPLLIIGI